MPRLTLALLCSLGLAHPALGAELTVFCPGAVRATVTALARARLKAAGFDVAQ